MDTHADDREQSFVVAVDILMDVVFHHGDTARTERIATDAIRHYSTVRAFYAMLQHEVRRTLGDETASVQLFSEGGHGIPADETPLLQLHTNRVHCRISTRARLMQCEPLSGPSKGGTIVRIHGKGLLNLRASSAWVRFGTVDVPVLDVVSDTEIRCRSPAHVTGIVRVRLLRCEDDRNNDDADEDDAASFEFLRLEHIYDAIFSTANRFCPLQEGSRADESVLDAAGRGEAFGSHQNDHGKGTN